MKLIISRFARLANAGFRVALAAVLCSVVAPSADDNSSTTVHIGPGMDIPAVAAANPPNTTFLIAPGTYRLQRTIEAKTGDTFIGEAPCAPPQMSCPTILSGSRIIGTLATFNGTDYQVTSQTQTGRINVTARECQPGWEGCIYPEDLFFDGKPLQHLNSASLPHILTGQWWFDYEHHVIYFHDDPAGHLVETSVVPSAFGGNGNNVRISQLTVEQFASPIGAPGTIGPPGKASLLDGLNWTIEKCEVLLNHGKGVRIAFGMQILDNYIHDNGHIGIGGGLATNSVTQSRPSNILISNNTITHNNFGHVLPGYEGGGIKITAATGVVIRKNTILHNDGAGIHFDISAASPLVDGNIVADNTGGDGIVYEISLKPATFRNNVLLRNGANLPTEPSANAGVKSAASAGMNAYCNVIVIPNAPHANGFLVGASARGHNEYVPGEYFVSEGNTFHHNTIIWEPGARGIVGYLQHDAPHQPNFFTDNAPPDFNTYHLSKLADNNFVYDGNNTEENTRKTFAQYRAAGADLHGTADTNDTSGFPTVVITSPADQTSFTNSIELMAEASDKSGIRRVEFYVDWRLESSASAAPYSFGWTDAVAGSHIVAAMAYSNTGIRSCYAVTLSKQ